MAMTLRLDDKHEMLLADLAGYLHCSKHQAVLRAIEIAEEHSRVQSKALIRVREIIETRDKELMDRLADS